MHNLEFMTCVYIQGLG